MQQFNDIPLLDEREVQTGFDDDRQSLLIFTTKMAITVAGARQLRDWLHKALEQPCLCADFQGVNMNCPTHGSRSD